MKHEHHHHHNHQKTSYEQIKADLPAVVEYAGQTVEDAACGAAFIGSGLLMVAFYLVASLLALVAFFGRGDGTLVVLGISAMLYGIGYLLQKAAGKVGRRFE